MIRIRRRYNKLPLPAIDRQFYLSLVTDFCLLNRLFLNGKVVTKHDLYSWTFDQVQSQFVNPNETPYDLYLSIDSVSWYQTSVDVMDATFKAFIDFRSTEVEKKFGVECYHDDVSMNSPEVNAMTRGIRSISHIILSKEERELHGEPTELILHGQ
jgi:hypothetical protein